MRAMLHDTCLNRPAAKIGLSERSPHKSFLAPADIHLGSAIFLTMI
jgi:hypothetical protein